MGGVALDVAGSRVDRRDDGRVARADVGGAGHRAPVGHVAVQNEMSEGVGAQLVQTARASAVTSSSRISVQDAVNALRLGGTEVSEKVTRVVVGIRAARDLSGGDVVLAGLIGEVGVEPMHGPGEAVSQVVGPLLGSILENALLQLGGDLGGHSFCFFRRDAGAQSK